MRFNKYNFAFWSFLIIINLLIGIYYILKTPSFVCDEFFVFSLIKNILNGDPSNNVLSVVSPALRPLYILILIFDYIILNCNPILIKSFSLLIHIITLIVFYILISTYFETLKRKVPTFIVNFIIFIFSINVISFYWITWISDQNELLMFILYLLSTLMFLLYFKHDKIIYLYLFLLFFVFSFLTKQTALNLPFITLFFSIYFKKEFKISKVKKSIYFSLTGIVLSMVFIIINMVVIENKYPLIFLLKKPLSLIGAVNLLLFQSLGNVLYSYFVNHLALAFTILVIFSSFVILLIIMSRFKRIIIIKSSFLLLFILLVFFPRGMGENQMIHSFSIQYFWILLLIIITYQFFGKQRKYFLIFLSFHFLLSIHNIFITFNEYITNSRNIESINSELIKATTASNKYLIICAFDSFNLPYHVYYLRNGCFGQDSIKVSPVNIIKNDNSQTKNTDSNSIECSLDSDTITVKVNSGELALQKIDFFSYQKSFTVIVDKDLSLIHI